MPAIIQTSPRRREEVREIIAQGSNPRPIFFIMVGLSTLIAAFGLTMSNTESSVVILLADASDDSVIV